MSRSCINFSLVPDVFVRLAFPNVFGIFDFLRKGVERSDSGELRLTK